MYIQTYANIYGTVIDGVSMIDRTCSKRAFRIDLQTGAHKIFIQELPLRIPDELHTNTNAEDLQDLHQRTT